MSLTMLECASEGRRLLKPTRYGMLFSLLESSTTTIVSGLIFLCTNFAACREAVAFAKDFATANVVSRLGGGPPKISRSEHGVLSHDGRAKTY